MIRSNNSDYYCRRAEQAERLAAAANRREVQAIHSAMAAHYRAMADKDRLAPSRPMLRMAF